MSKDRKGKVWRCPHGPSAGPGKVCGISGTSFTHDYHLENIVKKAIESRGWEMFNSDNDDDNPNNGPWRDWFIVQADKSTCQSNNGQVDIFGYPGVPTIDAQLLLDEISGDYNVSIGMIIQPTHRFDFNASDARYHSVVKRRLRQYPFPLCQEHILRDYATVAAEVRIYRDVDETLIPEDIKPWYVSSSDEEETVSESDGDVEIDSDD